MKSVVARGGLEADAGLTHAEVSCAAHVAGLGQVTSDTVTIVVEAAEVIEYTTEAAEEETTTSSDLFSDYSLEPKLVEGDSSEEYADADADTAAATCVNAGTAGDAVVDVCRCWHTVVRRAARATHMAGAAHCA